MSNMSYCRFGNTYQDLDDCYNAMCNGDFKDLSEREKIYRNKLVALCQQISDEFQEEDETEEEPEE